MWIPEGGKRKGRNDIKKIIAEAHKFEEKQSTHILEALQTLCKINSKKSISRHPINCWKTKKDS